MTKVLVLGGSGMLGSMVVDVLSREADIFVTATATNAGVVRRLQALYPNSCWRECAFDQGGTASEDSFWEGQQYIVNAIGITKPLIRDDNPAEVATAIAVNAVLPHCIGEAAAKSGARVLQIATDCVYSGAKGSYSEADAHDALDVYGKTKSLGETYLPAVHHLRCSIIGPEPKDFKFLVEWFRRQPGGAQLNGFVNHHWNGVTTLHFARLCLGVIRKRLELPHLQHVIPSDVITKAGMLHAFAREYARQDIEIRDVEAKSVIDRTLSTNNASLNALLWDAAGYKQPPTVGDMIREMAAYDYRAAAQAVTA